ncbi:MAG: SDR family NAD(P)-dependent oxidoreductase [bacterium]|nr:SDR family oxidoreductase [Acidimicrobiia bacterium]MCY4649210.1 SDR family NAD(P)-dependent oxidoreductase [bacterium]
MTKSRDYFSLTGQTAIVTGGAKGIGRAIADGLADAGARIVIADLAGAQEAAATYPEGVGVTVDVSNPDDLHAMVNTVLDACGQVDILVNNAGIYTSLPMRPFEQIPVEEWQRVMEVNVIGLALACRAVVPHMRARGGGRILNISSGTVYRGVPHLLHYVSSKGAVVAMTKALAKELGGDGILVNCIAPGFTISDGVRENPAGVDFEFLSSISVAARTIKRDQTPEDIVAAAVFLCSPGADFVTGQTMVIDGGQYFH